MLLFLRGCFSTILDFKELKVEIGVDTYLNEIGKFFYPETKTTISLEHV